MIAMPLRTTMLRTELLTSLDPGSLVVVAPGVVMLVGTVIARNGKHATCVVPLNGGSAFRARFPREESALMIGSITSQNANERCELLITARGPLARPEEVQDLALGSIAMSAVGPLIAVSEPPPREDHITFISLVNGRDIETFPDAWKVLYLTAWQLFVQYPLAREAALLASRD